MGELKQIYTANCHCGATVMRIQLDDIYSENHPIVSCNCSVCTKHGLAIRHCKRSNVTFLRGEEALKTYLCGNKTRQMRFCGVCGVVMLFDAFEGEKEPETVVAVNVCTIDAYEMDEVAFKAFDGRSVAPEYKGVVI